MQAVILAAGRSTRTYPLTLTKPKPLLFLAGTTVIEHNLDQLVGLVEEVVIVVGYKAEMIRAFLGEEYRGMRLTYVVQTETSGNASALALTRGHIKGRFVLMFGDDLYFRTDIVNILKCENAILGQRVDNPSNFGVLKVDGDRFIEVVEKPQEFISDLVNIGCFVFTPDIFAVLEDIQLSARGEYELTDAYNLLAQQKEIRVVPVAGYWLATTYPWSMLKANAYLLEQLESAVSPAATVETGATLQGKVVVGEGTVIKAGTYIEGPVSIGKDCVIGPNTYLRAGTAIGDNCHVGQACEIKNSILGSGTHVAHLSYVGDSILGENVNFGAGTITANLRHDGTNIKSAVGGKVVDSERKKLGVIVGDGCKTGVHTSFYPGVKMDAGMTTMPGEVVQRDIKK
jgi:bifunctional UDP-N-acetylglucosamine pyrophosphorylase/glucosamine-1-phosphate N-acetyltransferase